MDRVSRRYDSRGTEFFYNGRASELCAGHEFFSHKDASFYLLAGEYYGSFLIWNGFRICLFWQCRLLDSINLTDAR